MSINNEQLFHLARLSKLSVNDQAQAMTKAIGEIINLINHLQTIPTNNLSPMSHSVENSQPLREDIVTEHNQNQQIQKIAPEISDEGYFITPQAVKS